MTTPPARRPARRHPGGGAAGGARRRRPAGRDHADHGRAGRGSRRRRTASSGCSPSARTSTAAPTRSSWSASTRAPGAATSIGIPRDAWVELPDGASDRINAAYADYGPEVVTQVVADLVGIVPDYLAVVDFAAFEALLAEVGPVTVTSPEAFESHGVVVREGANTFDPGEALAYVRHRLSFVDQDFSRSANQQRLMAAALDAYQSARRGPGLRRGGGADGAGRRRHQPLAGGALPAGAGDHRRRHPPADRLRAARHPGRAAQRRQRRVPRRGGRAEHRRGRRGRRRRIGRRTCEPAPSRSDGSAQPGLAGPHDRLGPVRDLQLGEDVARVVADGLDREPERAGDLGVLAALRDQARGPPARGR